MHDTPIRANLYPVLTSAQLSRRLAIAEALLANLIWASTFVLVKIALNDLGPLTIGGLRYFAAFLLLLPFLTHDLRFYRSLPAHLWVRLIILGLTAYTVGNGALYWGLQYMKATTGSVEMSLIPLIVLFIGIFWLREIPNWTQLLGIIIALGGSVLFFSPGLTGGEPLALAIVLVGLLGFALSGILGREVARDRQVDTLNLTAIPLAAGGGLLLLLGLSFERPPQFTPETWFVVVWLAIVNTAVAYLLYNHSLQVLTAFEVNSMMNLTPLGTAALAWFITGETLDSIQVVGMVIIIVGVMLVQRRSPSEQVAARVKPGRSP